MASIANKDEALNCLAIGTKYLRAGDTDKALKYLYKSQKLYPTNEVELLISNINRQDTKSNNAGSSTSSSSQSFKQSPSPTPPPPTQSTPPSSSSTPAGGTTTYTAEELQIVTQIKTGKTHYDILGLADKKCTEKEIKIAYRKLAVRVHPDKNKAPGSEEAFKLVSNSYSVLSDSTKRRQYDLFGDTDAASTMNSQRYSQPTRNAFYTDVNEDITPEDIFNMFFNGQFGQPGARARTYTRTRRTYNPHTHHTQQAPGQPTQAGLSINQIIHFLPILLLLLFSWFSMGGTEDVPYSINRTPAMPVPRTTQKHGTQYYVDRSFMQRYGRDSRAIYSVDNMVEHAWWKHYDAQCTQEKHAQAEKMKQARTAANISSEKQAEIWQQINEMRFDSCEKMAEQYTKL